MRKLVLIRHGESTWNLENRFTGWTKRGSGQKLGIERSQNAGRLLKAWGGTAKFNLASTQRPEARHAHAVALSGRDGPHLAAVGTAG